MTVLFALFVVLFARAQQKTGFAATKADVEGREASRRVRLRLMAEVGGALGKEIAGRTVSVGEAPEGIVVSLKEVGAFRSGEADPLPAAVEAVERVSGVVARSGVPVRVEGHTDDQVVRSVAGGRGWRSNWELSTARAEATMEVLLAQPGIVPGRMSLAGYGAYRPVASNATEEGRRANRRVDLVMLCPP